ncbi:hypothetical protein [Sphingomonas colocasiae]|uniref:hypothetical protein n=1 Tax=Sphingomonas colocasiae TaxID=1848973 RepID=UPI001FE78273|nr:hypothetical protein [Sphingomonas colocasiae]
MEDKLTVAQGIIQSLGPVLGIIVVAAVAGWVITTWMRIRHGYPLDGAWGQAVYPRKNDEAVERVKLLTQENAQLRAEIGSIKDRLANVERIVTDEAHSLTREIEQLRGKTN